VKARNQTISVNDAKKLTPAGNTGAEVENELTEEEWKKKSTEGAAATTSAWSNSGKYFTSPTRIQNPRT
jgi:hypothetical protein